MLNIFYGKMPEAIFNTAVYFKNVYEDHWITDPFSRKMIADVDQSTVIGEAVIEPITHHSALVSKRLLCRKIYFPGVL